ncbi:SAM-dependent methyltransferase [Albimonas sp. CAU 1670]|uniref:SAM-dependent methyltransferase n=1 Tax=Albimonas sp. CAU 1670 TaxID=3032599 RepID=UPI0023DA0B1B|nr:SAM-dependent methyltransferase [Albimonas sp. CAU 1670]MDF2231287.1 SAM-dependent methyltransferase [Albimonas sp. CAU 1670]
MHVSLAHLEAIYADGDDPWGFRSSPYEHARLGAVARALPRARYASALEIGCGNGELARRIAPRCDAYLGVDAVEAALEAARRAAPSARFERLFVPAELPAGPGDAEHDLILLSEVLYFLDAPEIADLAAQIDRRWPQADILCCTWLGASGNALEGEAALALFTHASRRSFRRLPVGDGDADGYRLDLAAGAVQ